MFKKLIFYVLVILPIGGQLLLLPLVNRIDPILLGLPFLQFWLFLWILITPICTYGIYRLQKSEGGLES